MIVRLLGEGQYRVDESLLGRLNELDEQVMEALAAEDERGLWTALQALAEAVREHGEKVGDDELLPSDAVVPPEDLSLEEAKDLLQDEGFIPDVPVAAES
jgi:hypothetical protein